MTQFLSKIAIPFTLSAIAIAAVTWLFPIIGLCEDCIFYAEVASVALFFGGFIFREYVGFAKYDGKEKINGKTVLITGANTGIGLETAKDLANRGGRIIIASRDANKNEAARKEIIDATNNQNVFAKTLDLASQKSIREFCKDFNETENQLDILITNAGIMACPKMLTKEGIEIQLGVNHIGHFLLVNLLLDKLKASAPSRIVILSSHAHTFTDKINFDDLNSEKSYSRLQAYAQSKLANNLHALELSKRLEGTGVTAYAVHPGTVDTELPRHILGPFYSTIGYVFLAPIRFYFMKTCFEGAQTSVKCAVDPALETVSGKYYADCAEKDASKAGQDEAAAKRLWDISEEWTAPEKAKSTE